MPLHEKDKMKNLSIHYDEEADYLEVRFGKATAAYYENLGKDIFERRDEKTGKVNGYAIFNVRKRKEKIPRDIKIRIPAASF